jgi:hypothetical protein
MRSRYMIIATFAEFVNGRLNLLGGDIDRIIVAELPGIYPQIIVAARIALDRSESPGSHPFSFSIVDPDGEMSCSPFFGPPEM